MAQQHDITSPQPETRGRLLRAALDLFTQRGYSATSVREICAAAGVTKPVLYYHFKSKEGMYRALLEEPFCRFGAILATFSHPEGSAAQQVLDLCDRIFTLFSEHLNVARLMHVIYYGPPQGAPFFDFEVFHRKLHDLVKELVAAGIHKGELRPGNVEDMSWVLIGTLNVALEEQLCQRRPRLDRAGLGRLIRLVVQGFAAMGHADARPGDEPRDGGRAVSGAGTWGPGAA
ncbi:TetR/AcrR family transcriptional regulator [Geobacter sp. FeAm09]|uniref:TetR/AcrR family transcriptional regulator n=1 Tax=Geobacter sp. FeAm09 TaxID=2597769 RepID=UPI0011ED1DFD|nr:TetR/AcrR family transcriptional regulator [Geobacter sp. FeAm09]QEM66912.1 TetR/AcrR family transcriptional regulator [Geobacter sp. FeAm09]